MAIVMRQWGSPLGTLPGDGSFLRGFDHEAFNGRGEIVLTRNIQEAMKFADIREAVAFREKVPLCKPLRPDGKPNRPLSAATWEFVTIPD